MKKYQKAAVAFFLCSTVLYGGYKGYEKLHIDRQPPVVSVPEGTMKVSVTATEKDLLQGVKAEDNKSGDVSSTLVVEDITPFTEGVSRVVTYAAIDESGNVGRNERVIEYTDYEEPKFSLSGPLRIPSGKSATILDKVHASSSIDGDISTHIKYTFKDYFNSSTVGSCGVEFRVMDSAGNVVYLPAVVDVYDERVERIDVTLTDYLIYLNNGDSFDAASYYKEASVDGKLDIISNVDTSTAGVYTVDYVVSSNSNVGKSSLIVIVEDKE